MPRNPLSVSLEALDTALRNQRRVEKAKVAADEKVRRAMVRCVLSGASRRAVAARVGVSPQRISQIAGMPKGLPGEGVGGKGGTRVTAGTKVQ